MDLIATLAPVVDAAAEDRTTLWATLIFAASAVVVAVVNGVMQRTNRTISATAHQDVKDQLAEIKQDAHEIKQDAREIKQEARNERADVKEIRSELHDHLAGMTLRRAELIHDVEAVVSRAMEPWTKWAQESEGTRRRTPGAE